MILLFSASDIWIKWHEIVFECDFNLIVWENCWAESNQVSGWYEFPNATIQGLLGNCKDVVKRNKLILSCQTFICFHSWGPQLGMSAKIFEFQRCIVRKVINDNGIYMEYSEIADIDALIKIDIIFFRVDQRTLVTKYMKLSYLVFCRNRWFFVLLLIILYSGTSGIRPPGIRHPPLSDYIIVNKKCFIILRITSSIRPPP